MRRVGKGFSRVDTLLFDGMLVPQQVQDDVADVAEDEDAANEISAELTPPSPTPATTPPLQQTKKVGDFEQDKIAQAIKITKLKQTVRKLEQKRKLKASSLKRSRKVGTAERVESSANTGRLPVSQAHVYHLDLENAQKVLSMQETDEAEPAEAAAASLSVQSEVKTKDKGKGILVEEPKPLKRQAHIEQDEAFARELEDELNANINWNEVIEQKGEKEIEEEDGKRKSKNLEQKAAKKKKINEEVEELKIHLQIVPNDKDDVYTEATPLALKLFLSFISLLRNFDREDLEILWEIIQERFESSEPKNFSDDFLLNALKTMFEKPNVEDNIWKN
uniref:Uncharacterized protein n=1 Tax=Tanacetum cinerariifolium TaxID=118510 RepID=A0A6L2J3F5_TANCI|nr:hypothetical protein [Tanacetum cinerariifolium]